MTIALYARRKQWPLQAVDVTLGHSKIHAIDCAECETKEGKLDRIETAITLTGALGAGDVGTEEVAQRLVVVLPHDRAAARIDLDHAGVRRRMITAMRAVVEDEQVAVGQRTGIVLLGQRRAAELPDDGAGAAVDD